MNIQITLAYRYLSGRKLRTVLTTLAVVFGVLVLFGMNIILPSMMAALQVNEMAASGQVDVTITSISGGAFNTAMENTVKTMDGVAAAAVSLVRTVNLPADFYDKDANKPDHLTALTLLGIDPDAARAIRIYATLSGRFLLSGDTTSAVITQTLADTLNVKVGETFPIPTTQGVVHLTVAGILPPRTIPGNEEVLVNLPQAQAMMNETGKINTLELNLNTTDEVQRKAIISHIETAIGPQYKVGSLSTSNDLLASIRLGQQLMSLFGVLALFMGAFIIFNTFRTVVAERRRDIGMLRALGANRKTITGLILVESLMQGVTGTAAGLVIGYLFGAGSLKLIAPMMSQYVNLKLGGPVISAGNVILAITLGVGVTVLAGLIPAMNASKVTPLDALRPSTAEADFKRQTGRGFIAGMVIFILSLLALLSHQLSMVSLGAVLFLVSLVMVAPALVRPIANTFGWLVAHFYARSSMGELARGNLTRQPSRVAVTASATMLGLAIIVAWGGTVSSMSAILATMLKKNLGSDYLFIPPAISVWNSDVGSDSSFANQLRTINGVDAVSTLRFAYTSVHGSSVSLIGIEPQSFPKVSGLSFTENSLPSEKAVYQTLSDGRALIGNGAFMTQMKAKVGDTVELDTPSGVQPYHIVAVATDLLNAKVVTAFTSQANLQTDFNKAEDVFIQLNLKPSADAKAADTAIRKAAANYPQYTITTGKSYYDLLMSEMNAVFYGAYFLLAFLAVPSLIAMLNTLAIGVIERTREIGLIRAVGSTKKQVRTMVISEALILAGIGTAFGILAGFYLGYLLILAFSSLFPMRYAFPTTGIVAAVAIGLFFGWLAAVIPARQAARLEIVQALRYE